MVLFQVFSLKQRLKNKIFGSKLTLRFVVLFGLMAILPGALIYGVSVKFVSRSIDSWFEVHLDSALETGLNLGRSVIEAQLKELSNKGNSIALKISVIPVTEQYQALEMYREQAGIQEAAIYSLNGQILNKSISQQPAIAIGPLSPSIISQLEKNKHYSVIESIPDAGLYLRIVSPISGSILNTENKALQLLQPVPPQLAKDAEQLQLGYNQYQELQLSRNGIKRLYALTLTLTLLLALLSALGIAFLLSHKLFIRFLYIC
jgi:nitrogen fixation/metabolism regulation signal transduction histidine kinase